MAVGVVSIPVADQDRALAFYTDVLGLHLLTDAAMAPGMRWLQLQPADGGASVALVTWFESMPPGGLQGLLFHVADIDAEHARMGAAGVRCSAVEEQPWGRFTMLNDPDGNGLIVAQLTAPEDIATR
ncbi:MAG: VOC family protein [Janthinobacterium lividum]